MAILTNPAFGPRTSLAYITAGLLLDVWTLIYYFAFVRPEGPISNMTWFWLFGLGVTGLVLIFLGTFLGPIGRMARQVELPPNSEALQAEASIQRTAAANPAPVVAAPGSAGGVAGQPLPGQAIPQNGVPAAGVVNPPQATVSGRW